MADQPTTTGGEQQSSQSSGQSDASRENRGRRFQSNRDSTSSGGGGYGRRNHFRPRRKVCAFCTDKTRVISWKEAGALRRFVDDNGSIRARRKTGTCAKHQRRLAVAVKRARFLALLPFTGEHVRVSRRG